MSGSTQSQSQISVVVDGTPIGIFDTRSGGEVSADITTHRPGGTPKLQAYPGRSKFGDVTVTRVYDRERDVELARRLAAKVGRASTQVSEQPLDDDDHAWGKPTVWTGVLSSVDTGEVDSNSDDVRMLTLVMACTDRS